MKKDWVLERCKMHMGSLNAVSSAKGSWGRPGGGSGGKSPENICSWSTIKKLKKEEP